MHHIREELEILSMRHNALPLASSRKRPQRTYGEVEYEAQRDDRQLCRCLYASSWRFCRVQLWIYLTSNQRIVVPPSVPNACRHKNVTMRATHNKVERSAWSKPGDPLGFKHRIGRFRDRRRASQFDPAIDKEKVVSN